MNTLFVLLAVPAIILFTMWLHERRDKDAEPRRPLRLVRPASGLGHRPANSVAEVRFRAAMARR